MSYDRYVAVCKPLHYSTIMTQQVCFQLAIGSWASGALVSLVDTTFTFQLPYRGQNIINHYFCEPPALLKLASANTYNTEMAIFAMGVVILLAPVSLILVSYWNIISTVIQMQSGEGRLKAFSTCGSHLIVVVLFYGSGLLRLRCSSPARPLGIGETQNPSPSLTASCHLGCFVLAWFPATVPFTGEDGGPAAPLETGARL
ncbi:Olfactory receptor 2D3 [Galemys pyrenaicus]|uniref:Olfactory receptor 2D3 n=1 Tax=Galemys pyrenaicus TaxID=202257 RepID=A0A8J6APC8_GALPY|nr:Olfactory receptor 2D3 [Galemys pyrenaicus]